MPQHYTAKQMKKMNQTEYSKKMNAAEYGGSGKNAQESVLGKKGKSYKKSRKKSNPGY